MSFSSRAVIRATTASGKLSRLYLPPGTTQASNLYRPHRLGPVRYFKIRRVVTNNTLAGTEVTLPNYGPPKETGPALRRKSRPTPNSGTSAESAEHINADRWRSNLILPPDTYWDKWRTSLTENDAGGLLTAEKFVARWNDIPPETDVHVRKEVTGMRRIYACVSEFSLPLIGLCKVVSYGNNRTEARDNGKVALVSRLYQDGELDTIYKGTIASRKFIAVYEQAAKFGFHPRFKLSMSNDQPGAHFQITLAAPEWKVFAQASAPAYIDALSAVLESYETQTKKRHVKTRLMPQASEDRLDILSYKTADRALKYLLEKLQIHHRHYASRDDDTQGPQWTYRVLIKGIRPADVPTIRKADSRYIGITTTVVRLLQHFGYDKLDGFKESLEEAKESLEEAKKNYLASLREQRKDEEAGQSYESSSDHERLDQVEQIAASTSEEAKGQRDDGLLNKHII